MPSAATVPLAGMPSRSSIPVPLLTPPRFMPTAYEGPGRESLEVTGVQAVWFSRRRRSLRSDREGGCVSYDGRASLKPRPDSEAPSVSGGSAVRFYAAELA